MDVATGSENDHYITTSAGSLLLGTDPCGKCHPPGCALRAYTDATKRNDPMERFRNEQNMIPLKEPNATLDIPNRCDITSGKMAPLDDA